MAGALKLATEVQLSSGTMRGGCMATCRTSYDATLQAVWLLTYEMSSQIAALLLPVVCGLRACLTSSLQALHWAEAGNDGRGDLC
jgi:hypothetical protein